MQPIKKIVSDFLSSGKTKAVNHITRPGLYDMSQSNQANPYTYYRQTDDYENAFGSISVIANRSMVVEPYAIDAAGNAVKDNAIVNALYHPNQDMDAVEFREALAIFSLVHNKTYIRVHHTGSKPTPFNITGFTFLQGVSEIKEGPGAEVRYQVNEDGFVRQYTRDEVMVLKGINPYDLEQGYSPSAAARKWARLDDYIAEHEAGFFENGAVPKGQLIITAPSLTEYRDIKNALQAHHRGAGKNNNISYSYRPLDAQGNAQNAQIEWVPFNQDNKSLDLGNLFEQVNKKIDSAYLVPASMRADNDNNTYASVRVDEAILVDNTLRPRLIKTWGKFTHELNRITGGIGVAITFDLDTPGLADEDKVYAETKSIEMGIIKEMVVTQKYTLKSVVESFSLPDRYLNLKIDQSRVDEATATNNSQSASTDKPEVDEGGEVEESPDQEAAKAVSPKGTKQLSEIDELNYQQQVEATVRRQLERQVGRAIAQLDSQLAAKAYGDDTEEELTDFTDELLAEMIAIISIYGALENMNGSQLVIDAGLSTENIRSFYFTDEQRARYRSYLNGVAKYFNDQTADTIRDIVSNGIGESLSRAEIESQLRQVITGEFATYRAQRLARTEVQNAAGQASVISMENIQRDTGYKITKVWTVLNADACEFCKALDGTEVGVEEEFIHHDQVIEGIDGGIMKNNFVGRESALAHPQCTCTQTYVVEPS